MSTATAAPACPKCGGAMWDNRLSKTKPTQPDFKCKNKACDHAIWPPKANGAKQAHSIPAEPMEWEKEQEAEEQRFAQTVKPSGATVDKLNALLNGYSICFEHAASLAKKHEVDADVSAMAATMYIQACQKGAI